MQQWREGLSLVNSDVFVSSTELEELEENLGITWDWDRAVENFFATFGPDKLEELAQFYKLENIEEIRSQKNWLHNFMVGGHTEVADKMVEMGLDLNEVDLHGLLVYALRPRLKGESKVTDWWEWLLTHGASIGNPQLIAKLFQRATLNDDVMLLDWMKNNLFAGTDADRKILAQSLNASLPFALRAGATEATIWLLKHGVNTSSVLEEVDLLRAAMLGYLVDTSSISLPLAQHGREVDTSILDEMLQKIASDGVYEVSGKHILMMEHLLELGAKLTSQELQNILQRSLTKPEEGNWVMANWAVAQGADINQPDQHAVARAIIDNEVVKERLRRRGSHPIFNNVDIVYFLEKNGFYFKGIDKQYIERIAEERGFVSVGRMLIEER